MEDGKNLETVDVTFAKMPQVAATETPQVIDWLESIAQATTALEIKNIVRTQLILPRIRTEAERIRHLKAEHEAQLVANTQSSITEEDIAIRQKDLDAMKAANEFLKPTTMASEDVKTNGVAHLRSLTQGYRNEAVSWQKRGDPESKKNLITAAEKIESILPQDTTLSPATE